MGSNHLIPYKYRERNVQIAFQVLGNIHMNDNLEQMFNLYQQKLDESINNTKIKLGEDQGKLLKKLKKELKLLKDLKKELEKAYQNSYESPRQ